MTSFSLVLLVLITTWPLELILPLTGMKGKHIPEIASNAQRVSSVYTSILDGGCHLQQSDEMGSELICPGVSGYKLKIVDFDNRMTVSVIDPRGREHPLNFQDTITRGFSTLGKKAEWRVVRKNGALIPIALIIRVNQDEINGIGEVSYLSVSKISRSEICVTDRINPTVNQNSQARRAADAAASKPCRPSVP